MRFSASLVLSVASIASTASAAEVVTLLLPTYISGGLPYEASIVASDASATTYSVSYATTYLASQIPDGAYSVAAGIVMTEGPKTAKMTASYDSYSEGLDCSLDGTTSAVCTIDYSGNVGSDGSAGSTVVTLSSTDLVGMFSPVTIINDKRHTPVSAAATTTTAAAPASSITAASGSSTSTTPTASSPSATTSAATASDAPLKTGGAMPHMTSHAAWTVGVVALAAVIAAL